MDSRDPIPARPVADRTGLSSNHLPTQRRPLVNMIFDTLKAIVVFVLVWAMIAGAFVL